MGRQKHCTDEQMRIICDLRKRGKTYKDIANTMTCSINMVVNALKRSKKTNICEKRGRKMATSATDDRAILKAAKKDPFLTSRQILGDINLNVSTRTIRRRLQGFNLPARSPKKTPLSKRNIKKRLQFAKKYLNWKKENWGLILWSDESKINLINSDGRSYVRRPKNTAFHPKYTKKTVKHGGGNILVWGCFSPTDEGINAS